MDPIQHERKNAVGKQKISSKYHQLVEKCNSLHASISCVIQLVDLSQMDSVMPALYLPFCNTYGQQTW